MPATLFEKLTVTLKSIFDKLHRDTAMPQQPADFNSWYLHAKLPQIRYIALVTTMLYLIYSVAEYHVLPDYHVKRFLLHGMLVPATMASVGILTHFPRHHRAMLWLLVLAPIAANSVNIYLNFDAGLFSYFSPEIYLSIMWTFAISGLRLRHALVSAACSCLVISIPMFTSQLPAAFVQLHLMWLFSAFSFGFVSALVLEKVHYNLYQKQMELALLASRDPLTQLWNRQKMATLFTQEKQAANVHQAMSLIMIDIDHFKSVNDEFGHEAGDIVLQHFARLLENNVRKQDHVGRFGGEEFVIILPNTSGGEALTVAHKLQQAINQYDFPTVGRKTASMGVTEAVHRHEPLATMMHRADCTLYQAKEQGRNRVLFADIGVSPA
ncbi:GGDEF domain-containing protein [Shewanella avicenniae]|uniref:diguanylate cyclase n=1 Tax=Shewanella avicenniae TaxID=2814294 RepID=A0ABX7QQ50_9GAMM|nr:GGDEF domain-containing protein [Shewanella avicenniae]QSX33597.1 GGDEF domain-containing protein [Shewanella avicenniae]